MSFGPSLTQSQFNQALTSAAQKWLDAATASQQLYEQVNGAGGQSWLESPLGYSPADATAILALIGQYNQAAGLLAGTGTLAQAFAFLQSFGQVLNPVTITQ